MRKLNSDDNDKPNKPKYIHKKAEPLSEDFLLKQLLALDFLCKNLWETDPNW